MSKHHVYTRLQKGKCYHDKHYMDRKAYNNKIETKLAKRGHEQWNGCKVQMQCQQKQVLARLKGPFVVVPQLVYSKTNAKSEKKPSRHFIRSEAFVHEKGYLSKKDQATELTRFQKQVYGFPFFWLKTKILKRECWVYKFYLRWFFFKKLGRNKSQILFF